jgi:hypothetical protein
MNFETNSDVLDWYERQPRTLTPEFVNTIPWPEVKATALDERFIPVLLYMRDVEGLTDMYYREPYDIWCHSRDVNDASVQAAE